MYKLQTLNSILIDENQLKIKSMTWHWPRSYDGVAQCHDLAMEEEEEEVEVGPTGMEKQVGN